MHKAAIAVGLVLSCFAVTGAIADAIPIKGSYGDKEGCKYAKTGEPSGADVFFLLTKEDITTAASVCTFGKLVSSAKTKIVVNMTCQSEDESADDVATITPSGKNAYLITMKDGGTWGPWKACK
jgi:hypothetical protein